jgi:hypothetical protein
MAIEVAPVILELVLLGWVFTLGSYVVEVMDRRSHRADMYEMMKVNLAAWQERLTTPYYQQPNTETAPKA